MLLYHFVHILVYCVYGFGVKSVIECNQEIKAPLNELQQFSRY